MNFRMHIRMLLDRLRRDQDGIAIPTVMIVTSIGFAFVTVALVSSVNAQHGTIRDQDSKQALAVADAGLNVALLRANRYQNQSGAQCAYLVNNMLTTGPATNGWCPPVSGTVDGKQYTYQSTPATDPATGQPQAFSIFSTGTSDGVSRRLVMTVEPEGGSNIFEFERVVTNDFITLNSNAQILTSMGTNGDVTMNSNAVVCGNLRYGQGEGVTESSNAHQCPGYARTEGDRVLPDIYKPGLATNNSNFRFFGLDIRTEPSSVSWNASSRVLSLNGNSTLTMGGSDYFLCRLTMDSNSRLIMAAGAKVRIYFDTPENCGQPSGTAQLEMKSNTEISSTGYNPAAGSWDLMGFFFLGSPNRTTRAILDSNASVTNEFVLYGPRTDVQMNSNSTYVGAIAARSLYLDSNARITSDANMPPPVIDVPVTFAGERFLECPLTATTC